MKKLSLSLVAFIFTFIFLSKVSAKSSVEISSVDVSAKTDNVSASVSSFKELTFNTKESFYEVGDYVTYKVTLKNNTSKNLPIESISDNLNNKYIQTSYSFEKQEIKSGEEYSFYATIKYINEIKNDSINLNFPIKISIKYSNGDKTDIVVNPNTKDNMILYVGLFIVSIISIILLKNKKKKLLVVLLTLCLIPTIGHAVNESLTANMNNNIGIYKKVAVLKTGKDVNKVFKDLAGTDTSSTDNAVSIVDSNIKHIVRVKELPSDINLTSNNVISDDSSTVRVYAWYTDGTIYYYTNTEKIFLNENSLGLFGNLSKVEDIDLTILDTSKVKSFKSMFYNDYSLKNIDLSNFDTSNATNMSTMFSRCTSLTNLDLSSFDTSNVQLMNGMFQGCINIETLDLSNFNTSSVTNMQGLFLSTTEVGEMKLKEVKGLDKFDTRNVTNMRGMFQLCTNLETLDLSKWVTNNVTDMAYMFNYCTKLKELKIDNFDTTKVTNFEFMFGNCNVLPKIDVSKFNTSNATNMRGMFYNCYAVAELDTSKFDTSKVTDMGWMFGATAGKVMKLTTLDLRNFNTSNVVYMDGMFQNCTKLTSLNVSSFDTSKVTTMEYMFCDCSNLTTLDVSNFNTSNVTNMRSMFEDCNHLTSLDVTNFDTSKVTTMEFMFTGDEGPWKLTSLDLSSFDTSKVTNMHRMLYNLGNVTVIYVSDKFVTTKVTNSKQMFTNDKNLVGSNGTVYDSTKQEKEYARIDSEGVPGYFTAKN